MPKELSVDSSLKKAEQVAELRRHSELQAEQARIDAMQERYAKRKAILDIQHQ